MLTCKDFLKEISDFLDNTTDVDTRRQLEAHINECPNCFVIVDTARQTIKVYKGMEAKTIPPQVHDRLMSALQRKIAAKKQPAT